MKFDFGFKKKNERHVLVDSYFYIYISHLSDFDTDDMVSILLSQFMIENKI